MKPFRKKIAAVLAFCFMLQSVFGSYAGSSNLPIAFLSATSTTYQTTAPTEFLTFYSDTCFTLSAKKNWNGTMIYYDPVNAHEPEYPTKWYRWLGGTEVLSSYWDEQQKSFVIKVCGVNNSFVTGRDNDISLAWDIEPYDAQNTEISVFLDGNIMTLLDYEKVEHGETIAMADFCFAFLFNGCRYLCSTPQLPALTLSYGCYYCMFNNCKKLSKISDLPATGLNDGCYACMFSDCTALITAAVTLPAETACGYCYQNMFSGCTSLKRGPTIKLKTMAEYCCSGMFYNCIALDTPPDISATTLATNCCESMFYDCTSLNVATSSTAMPKWTLPIGNCGFDDWDNNILHGSANHIFNSEDLDLSQTYYIQSATKEVTWDADGGSIPIGEGVKTYSEYVPYGDVPAPPENPEKPSSVDKVYTFKGWREKNGTDIIEQFPAVTEDTTYVAVYDVEARCYDVSFVCKDNTATSGSSYGYIKEGDTAVDTLSLPYGAKFNVNGDKLIIKSADETTVLHTLKAVPKADDTNQYTYSFKENGWSFDPASALTDGVTGDSISVTAEFERTENTFTVIWKNENGDELEKDENVAFNAMPHYDGATPTKDSTAEFHYTFDKWTPGLVNVNKDATYTASYTSTKRSYAISWKNEDDTLIRTDTVEYGTTPAFHGTLPTKASTVQYDYTFAGWTPQIISVTGDASYKATFTEQLRSYPVHWLNWDGSLLKTDTIAYGSTPSYSGRTPARESTAQYSYTFAGWTPEVTAVSGEVSYRAVFTESLRSYSVTWKNDDGSVLKTESLTYGTVPSYSGTAPAKTSTAQYDYTFSGWSPQIAPVGGDAVYVAAYTETLRSYTVTWNANGHGTAPAAGTFTVGSLLTKPTDLTAGGYTFGGWYKESSCTNAWNFTQDTMPAANLELFAKWTYTGGGGGGGTGGGGGSSSSSTTALPTTTTYSVYWLGDTNGVWRCFNPLISDFVRSAWLCDDAVTANGQNVWYLMNTDGTMLAANLVQDNTGHYYSLETSHYGYFGSLRYKNGTYDGIYMEFSQKHDGSFGAITNQSAIDALKAKYGVTRFGIGNESSVYTSSFSK